MTRILANSGHVPIIPPVTKAIIDKYTEDIAVDGSLIQKELGFIPQYAFSFKNVRKILVFS